MESNIFYSNLLDLEPQPQEVVIEATDVIAEPPIPIVPVIPRIKQKRKEPIVLRPLDEDDVKLILQVIEEPLSQDVEIKRKPRREYRSKKKIQRASEKLAKHNVTTATTKTAIIAPAASSPPPSSQTPETSSADISSATTTTTASPLSPSKYQHIKDEPNMPERRTRLSNTCRVATGKTYKCHDCDFSTDRINNIVIHIKESCPKLRRS